MCQQSNRLFQLPLQSGLDVLSLVSIMENPITIFDSQRQKVGDARAVLCFSLQDLTENFVIHKFAGGLFYYQAQFPFEDFWPIFVLEDIWIYRPHRKVGIGSQAFNEIADHYQELGAQIGLLRIGTQGDEFDEGMAWRKRMYSKLGWIELEHRHDEQSTIPLMYLPMKKRALTSLASERLIQVHDPAQDPLSIMEEGS